MELGYQTLQSVLDREKGMDVDESIATLRMLDIAKGLHTIHRENIIHRDLKPENILADKDGLLKIADFGASRLLPRDGATTFAGTPAYMDPSVFNAICQSGEPYSKEVDLSMVGMVAIEVLGGKLRTFGPIDGSSAEALFASIEKWKEGRKEVSAASKTGVLNAFLF